MKDLLSQIEAETYMFKEPWRASNKSLTIVVPIVTTKPQKREYVMLEEVKDKVHITDTGNIGQAKIEGEVDKPTFIRGGTMLKGATQERATQFSIIAIPEKAEQVPVHCIHASKAIRPGTHFTPAGYAPHPVSYAMMAARNQSYTWSAVSSYCLSATNSNIHYPVSHDDLVTVYENVQKFREDLKEILQGIPDYVNQVGTVIIDPDGVVGMEMYDHPDSWKAVSENIHRSFAEALAKEDKTGIFKPDLDAAIIVIKAFLKEIEKAEKEEVFNKNDAQTFIIKTEGFVGEYSTLNGKTIHLLITRKETREAEHPRMPRFHVETITPRRRETPMATTSPTTYTYYLTAATTPTPLWGRKGLQVLHKLEKPKTWTDLTSELKMSKATISSHLKTFQTLGLVEKSRDPNGKTRYYLTAKAQQLQKD